MIASLESTCGSFQTFNHDTKRFDPGEEFAVRFENRPRCVQGARSLKHVDHGQLIMFPFSPIAPIPFGNLPLFLGIGLSPFKPPKLFIRIDMKPELDDYRAKVGQLAFKFINFPVSSFPFLLRAVALNAFYQHPSVPGAVKDRDMSRLGNASPKPP